MKRMPLAVSALLLAVSFSASCSSSGKLDTAHAQIAFGVKAARMNLWREARFRFERAVQNNPNDAMAHNNLAVALEGAGEFDRARLEYLQALQFDQSNQYIQKNYSRFMEFYGKKKKEMPKPAAEDKAATTPSQPATPTLPPVIDETKPPPGVTAAGGTTPVNPPPLPVVPPAPKPAPPSPPTEPPNPPPPNGGTTGGQR